MTGKSKSKSPFVGRWRITWMEMWDQDFVDAEVKGHFEFKPNSTGGFQFDHGDESAFKATTAAYVNREP